MLVAYLVVLIMLSTGLAGLPARADQESWRRLPPTVQRAIEREVPPWTAVEVVSLGDGRTFRVSWTEGHRRIAIHVDVDGRLATPSGPMHRQGQPDMAGRALRR